MPNFQVFLLMTISNHVNFEKLLLNIFDTKYKSRNGGVARAWNVASRRTFEPTLYLRNRFLQLRLKTATDSYRININMSKCYRRQISNVKEELAKCVVVKNNKS